MINVLVIEDDPAVAESILFVLGQNGYAACHVTTGRAAADKLNQQQYSCALIDVWLGDEDGLDLLSRLRGAGNDLPVIIMSGGGPGRTLETVSTRADVLDARTVLFKPFSDGELLDAIRKACGEPGPADGQ